MSGEYQVKNQTKRGVTSSAPAAIVNVTAGSHIRAFYTGAGTATVYSTGSDPSLADADIAAGGAAIAASTNAKWTAWAAGAVTADTTLTAVLPQTYVAIVVTSGTWTLEVCQ